MPLPTLFCWSLGRKIHVSAYLRFSIRPSLRPFVRCMLAFRASLIVRTGASFEPTDEAAAGGLTVAIRGIIFALIIYPSLRSPLL